MRFLTHNIHLCQGADRKPDVGGVAAVIAAEHPDIVARQEIDVGRRRTGGVDQAHDPARRRRMTSRFRAALIVEPERYGDGILTALPERLLKAGPLPGHTRIRRLEPRGAWWVAIDVGGGRDATFPLAAPVFRIDHLFVSAGIVVRRLAVVQSKTTRIASDPLPLAMDFDLEAWVIARGGGGKEGQLVRDAVVVSG